MLAFDFIIHNNSKIAKRIFHKYHPFKVRFKFKKFFVKTLEDIILF